ncbi:GNAT family protein [Streptomyces capparidis]
MLAPDFPIRTERLELRPFAPGDLAAVHACFRVPDVVRHLRWEPLDLEGARQLLAARLGRSALRAEGDVLHPAVVLRATGEVIGEVMLQWTSEPDRQGEIGYVLHPRHCGHGYATEAAREMLRLGFEGLRLHRIAASLDAENTASARVVERLGMRREARLVHNHRLKGSWRDELVYAMLEDEWPGSPR